MEEKCRSNRKQTFQKQKKSPVFAGRKTGDFLFGCFSETPFRKNGVLREARLPESFLYILFIVFLRQSQEISPDKAYSQNEGILLQTYSPTGKSRGFSLFCVR